MKDYDGKTAKNLAKPELACIILAAINEELKVKLEENKIEAVCAEDMLQDIQSYNKRKLKATLESLESKKKKHQEDLSKLDRVINEVKKCLNSLDPGETLEEAKTEFECPICMDVMKPPKEIWQCDAGHALCGDCKNDPRIQKCPTCRKDITCRNRAMENLYHTLF